MPRGRGEMTFWKVTCRITETAKLVRSIVATLAPRTGRKAIRSIRRAAAMAVAIVATSAGVKVLHLLLTRRLDRRMQAWRRR